MRVRLVFTSHVKYSVVTHRVVRGMWTQCVYTLIVAVEVYIFCCICIIGIERENAVADMEPISCAG